MKEKKRKTLIFYMIVFLLLHLFNNTCHAFDKLPDTIKIGLYFDNSSLSSVELSSKSGFEIGYIVDNQYYELTGPIYEHNLIVIADINNNDSMFNIIKILSPGQDIPIYTYENSGDALYIKPMDENQDIPLININNIAYRGAVELKINNSNKLTVVNIVNLEEYLYSVLPKEMSWNWPMEALKAQAVAARTYAILHINKYIKQGFNLCATTASQVYGGYNVEHPNCTQAVEATRGEILKYENKPASTYYFSSSGGYTEDIRNVWGGEYIPYLTGVSDQYEPTEKAGKGIWKLELTRQEIQQILSSKAYDLGELISIIPLERSESGGVIKLSIKGTKGEKIFEIQDTRMIFGANVIYSQKYSVTPSNNNNIHLIDGSQHIKAIPTNEIKILTSGQGEAILLDNEQINITDGQIVKGYNSLPNSFIFDGRGYGHGIGMSQWGAYGMAEAGFKYNEILEHYFPGTNID